MFGKKLNKKIQSIDFRNKLVINQLGIFFKKSCI